MLKKFLQKKNNLSEILSSNFSLTHPLNPPLCEQRGGIEDTLTKFTLIEKIRENAGKWDILAKEIILKVRENVVEYCKGD